MQELKLDTSQTSFSVLPATDQVRSCVLILQTRRGRLKVLKICAGTHRRGVQRRDLNQICLPPKPTLSTTPGSPMQFLCVLGRRQETSFLGAACFQAPGMRARGIQGKGLRTSRVGDIRKHRHERSFQSRFLVYGIGTNQRLPQRATLGTEQVVRSCHTLPHEFQDC